MLLAATRLPRPSILTLNFKEQLVIQSLNKVILTSCGAHQSCLCKRFRRWKHAMIKSLAKHHLVEAMRGGGCMNMNGASIIQRKEESSGLNNLELSQVQSSSDKMDEALA